MLKSFYTKGEEIFNSVTHGIGTLLGTAGMVLLVIITAISGEALNVVAASIYGATLMILYLSSTLYHALTNPKAKSVFRILDHCNIFLLIAGTYTPFTLISLRGAWGYTLFAVVWASAIIGIVLNAINLDKYKKLSLVLYVAMGWVVITAIKPLFEAFTLGGIILLITGGLCYTLGLIFYGQKRIKYMHSIWHLFVLAGSIFHYFCILIYVCLPLINN